MTTKGFIKLPYIFKNILTVSSGNLVVYLIGVIATPLMTRLYPVEVYGQFAYFNSLAMIFAALSRLNLQGALLIAKEDELRAIIAVILKISFFVAVLFGVVSAAGLIPNLSGIYVFILPLFILVLSLAQVVSTLSIRQNHFATLSKAKVTSTVVGKGVALAAPLLFQPTVLWMILSEGCIKLIESLLCIGKLTKLPKSNLGTLQILSKYKKYPLYSFPANILSLLILQIPIYTILYFYSPQQLGLYSLASSILALPSIIVVQAVAPILVSTVSAELQNTGVWNMKVVLQTLTYLAPLAMIPFLLVQFFGGPLFSLIFGRQWELSGEFAALMSASFFFIIITSSLIPLLQVKRQQEIILRITITQVVFTALSVGILILAGLTLREYLLLHSIVMSFVSFGVIWFLNRQLSLDFPKKGFLLLLIYLTLFIVTSAIF